MITQRRWSAGFAAVIVVVLLSLASPLLPPMPF